MRISRVGFVVPLFVSSALILVGFSGNSRAAGDGLSPQTLTGPTSWSISRELAAANGDVDYEALAEDLTGIRGLVMSFAYDRDGNLSQIRFSDPKNSRQVFRAYVDGDMNTRKILTYLYHGSTSQVRLLTLYDSDARKTRDTSYDSSGEVLRVRTFDPDTGNLTTLKNYNADGTLVRRFVYDPRTGFFQARYIYDLGTGNLDYVQKFDAQGRLESSWQYDTATGTRTEFTYFDTETGYKREIHIFDSGGILSEKRIFNPGLKTLKRRYYYFGGTTDIRRVDSYNLLGQLKQTDLYDQTTGRVTLSRIYDPATRTLLRVVHRFLEITDLSIPETGLVLDVPYYIATYQITRGIEAPQTVSQVFTLNSGSNVINITAQNEFGDSISVSREIIYQSPEHQLSGQDRAYRGTLLNENSRYFMNSNGIHPKTGFPIDLIGDYAPPPNILPWTQPTSIGFYLQYLADVITRKIQVAQLSPDEAMIQAEKVLNSLLDAQTALGHEGLLPWIKLTDPPTRDRETIVFLDNINLSQSMAVFAGGLIKINAHTTTARGLYDKALTFLNRQRQGYQRFYDAQQGLLRRDYYLQSGVYSTTHNDILGNEIRSGIAFAVAYFGVPSAAWDNLYSAKAAYLTKDGQLLSTLTAYDGGAFQIFWNLLRAPEHELPEIRAAVINALIIEEDFMTRNNLPGFPSASSVPDTQNTYSGKIGIPAIAQNGSNIRDDIGSLYALAAAYTADPARVLALIRDVESRYPGLRSALGFYDAADTRGNISRNYYAIDQGSFVVGLAGAGPVNFKTFMEADNKYGVFENLYASLNLNITEDPPTQLVLFDDFDGNGIGSSFSGSDGVYIITDAPGAGPDGSTAKRVAYDKKTAPFAHIKVFPGQGTDFSDFSGLRFRFRKTTDQPENLTVKFEKRSGTGAVQGSFQKTFNFQASDRGWQDIIYLFPQNNVVTSILQEAREIVLFADIGQSNLSGEFLIDDIRFWQS